MNIFRDSPGTFGGVRIIADINMVDPIEDWSEVRSHARAKRRRKRGFPQRIKTRYVPKKHAYAMHGGRTLVMHPELAKELDREMAKDPEQRDTEKWLREHGPSAPGPASPWRQRFSPIPAPTLGYFFNSPGD